MSRRISISRSAPIISVKWKNKVRIFPISRVLPILQTVQKNLYLDALLLWPDTKLWNPDQNYQNDFYYVVQQLFRSSSREISWGKLFQVKWNLLMWPVSSRVADPDPTLENTESGSWFDKNPFFYLSSYILLKFGSKNSTFSSVL